ncbi:MAG: PAS domain-containing protein, partial [Jatrophihabitantaceae bacterium]
MEPPDRLASSRSESSGPTSFLGTGELAGRIRDFDWSSTPVGPIEDWPQSLRTTVSIMLNTQYAMFLFWGEQATCLYNDAYRPSLGHDMHPRTLGRPGAECWSDIWHIIGPQFSAVMSRGEHTWFEDQLVPYDRNGYFEEIYFTYSYSPVYDESGTVGGCLVVCSETTDRVLAERRLLTLQALSVVAEDETATVVPALLSTTGRNDADISFAVL